MMRPGIPMLLAVVLPLVAPATIRSQTDQRLDAAELAADAGDVDRAREYLRSWLDSEAAARPDADVGRALFLRARLAENVDSAAVDYLEAAVRGDEPEEGQQQVWAHHSTSYGRRGRRIPSEGLARGSRSPRCSPFRLWFRPLGSPSAPGPITASTSPATAGKSSTVGGGATRAVNMG